VRPLSRQGENAVSERTRKPILLTGLALIAALGLLRLLHRDARYLRLD
jgi:hypothetical protein